MSILTFLAIKAKIIIVATVAFTIFMFGAKTWAMFKYGNLLFDKGCSKHNILSHAHPVTYGHDIVEAPVEFEGYGYENYVGGGSHP